MLYNLMFSEQDIQKLMLILEASRDIKIIKPQEVTHILNYISDEVEVQDRALKLTKEGKNIFESMKIDVNLIKQ